MNETMKSEREISRDALAYIENQIHDANQFLSDAESTRYWNNRKTS